MERAITSFVLDDEAHWVAVLACGHRQHVRHKPPFEVREWVISEAGRAAHVGSALDCPFCDQPALPSNAVVYKTTKTFTEATVPAGLLRDHRTKDETWGRIVVTEGRLLYTITEGPKRGSWMLNPQASGIIEPGVLHHVATRGGVMFRVEFLRAP